ncbi:Cof-like hydrolase [Croceitalea dokdonensis DOKDO 023]|uniref:Cof-like hydrolase n=2 Tax=Croceitalea TaxID=574891 RepID=A0A0P7AIE6_9FLAO|nr:Cof-like hydrolase [Croceitalea dokdonensis DOKDO 023]
MVVTDMDGTLLNSQHEVSNRFFELFQALKEKNILFVAASGRQYDSMVAKLEAIKDDIIFVAENGALVKKKNHTLCSTPLEHQYIKQVLDLISPIPNAHPVLCGANTAYVNGASLAFIELLKEYYTAFSPVTDQYAVHGEIMKIAVYHDESSERNIYPQVAHLEDKLKVKVSGAHWIDISHPDAHKGHALAKLMQTYGVGSHELLVFGDYNNDLEMLELAQFSVAMENAHQNVKKTAKYHTTSNDDLGVERVLEKLLRS